MTELTNSFKGLIVICIAMVLVMSGCEGDKGCCCGSSDSGLRWIALKDSIGENWVLQAGLDRGSIVMFNMDGDTIPWAGLSTNNHNNYEPLFDGSGISLIYKYAVNLYELGSGIPYRIQYGTLGSDTLSIYFTTYNSECYTNFRVDSTHVNGNPPYSMFTIVKDL